MKKIFKFITLLFLISACTSTVKENTTEEQKIIKPIVEKEINSTDTANKRIEERQAEGIKRLLYHCSDNWEELYSESDNYWNSTGIRGRYQKIRHKIGIHILQTILDENVFLAGPHDYGFMNYQSSSFGEYNPLFLSNLYNELSKLYSDEEFVNNFQYLYDSQLKRYLRTYYISYSYAANNEKYIFEYSPNFDEFSTKIDRKGYNWYEANTCSKFWVRRSIDGTSNDFFKLLSLALETFDTNFLHENKVKEIKMQDSISYGQWISNQYNEGC
jgi:hypothetical protein